MASYNALCEVFIDLVAGKSTKCWRSK